jgi:hypothetical protein
MVLFEEDSVLSQWFWRIVVTFLIILTIQWLQGPPESAPDEGNQLQNRWSSAPPDEHKPSESSGNHRSNRLGQNEERGEILIYDDIEEDVKQTLTDDLIYDDIEDDHHDTAADEAVSTWSDLGYKPSVEKDLPPEPVSVFAESKDSSEGLLGPSAEPAQTVPPSESAASSNQRPPIKAKHGHHPGLDGFRRWYEVEASLYRIYTVGRTDGVPVAPPFIPKSERGHISLDLRVINNFRRNIATYWVDYRGNEVFKGKFGHGSVFRQTTWIGHPWVFREENSGNLLCHYIPYRIIPTTEQVPTIDPDDPDMGVHQFSIVSLGQRQVTDEGAICHILDPVFPTVIESTRDAAAWTFQQLARANYMYIDTVQKYLSNVVLHPHEVKYRQIRIAQRRFSHEVWLTPARGLFLAAGFVEQGAYAELGSADTLPRERVQEISTLLFYIHKWKAIQGQGGLSERQPEGADGHGRAGFGRVGMNGTNRSGR